jgi:hypothetical protein
MQPGLWKSVEKSYDLTENVVAFSKIRQSHVSLSFNRIDEAATLQHLLNESTQEAASSRTR